MTLDDIKKLLHFEAAEITTDGNRLNIKLPLISIDTDADKIEALKCSILVEANKAEAIDEIMKKVLSSGSFDFLKPILGIQTASTKPLPVNQGQV